MRDNRTFRITITALKSDLIALHELLTSIELNPSFYLTNAEVSADSISWLTNLMPNTRKLLARAIGQALVDEDSITFQVTIPISMAPAFAAALNVGGLATQLALATNLSEAITDAYNEVILQTGEESLMGETIVSVGSATIN